MHEKRINCYSSFYGIRFKKNIWRKRNGENTCNNLFTYKLNVKLNMFIKINACISEHQLIYDYKQKLI